MSHKQAKRARQASGGFVRKQSLDKIVSDKATEFDSSRLTVPVRNGVNFSRADELALLARVSLSPYGRFRR